MNSLSGMHGFNSWAPWSLAPSRQGRGIAAAVLVSLPLAGLGQGPVVDPEVMAQVQPLNRIEAEQERLRQRMAEQPEGYQDKYLDAQDLELISAAEEAEAIEPTGARSLLVEARTESSRQRITGAPRQIDDGQGFRVEYRLETMNHGEWVIQADTRRRIGSGAGSLSAFAPSTDSRSGQKLTLRNQSFPVTPFTLADANLGDVSAEITDGLTRGQQFSLGSSTLRGASTHVFGRLFDLRLGLGDRGQLVGGPFPSYEKTQGRLAWAGYTHRFDPLHYAAVQVNQGLDLPGFAGAPSLTGAQDITSVAASVGRGYQLEKDGDTRLRLTALHSRTAAAQGQATHAQGAYLDAGLQHERHRIEGGLYLTDPQLRFADQTVSNGNQGLYTRYQQSSLRLNWGLSLTLDRQDREATGGLKDWTYTSLNTYWTHRLGRQQSWGGNLQVARQQRDSESTGQRSHYGSLYYIDNWHRSIGNSRLQWTTRRNQALVNNGPAASGDELSWEQDWWASQEPGAQNPVLRTQLGWAKDRSLGDTITYPTAGLTWQTWPLEDWSLGGSLRYTSRRGNLATSRGLAGSIQTEKRLAQDWMVGAALLLNQAVVDTGSGAGANAVNISRSDDQSLWVFLRYEVQSGRPYGYNLRAGQGAGTGRITGLVFLDANRDGIQQSDEPGVGGVEVFLNQRQRVTTDNQGRYEFGVVPTGPQFLNLRPESVPLPWGEGPRSRLTVEVPLRGTAIAPLAVVKDSP